MDFSTLKKRLNKKTFDLYPVSNKINRVGYRGDASAIIPISFPGPLDTSKERKEQNVNILNFVNRVKEEHSALVKQEISSNLKLDVEECKDCIIRRDLCDREVIEIAALDRHENGDAHEMTDQEMMNLACDELDEEDDDKRNFEECFVCFKKVKRSLLQEHVNGCLDKQLPASDSNPNRISPSKSSSSKKRSCSKPSFKSPSVDGSKKRQQSIFDFIHPGDPMKET